jgi:hypothetical protein
MRKVSMRPLGAFDFFFYFSEVKHGFDENKKKQKFWKTFCAYWSSSYNFILKIWNFGIFLNKNAEILLKKVNSHNFGLIKDRAAIDIIFCVLGFSI